MRLTTGIGAFALLQFGLQACTPSTNVPGTELFVEAADGKYHGPMESLAIEPNGATIEVSVAQDLKAIGVFEDGTRVDVTEIVYWRVDNESVVTKSEGFEGGALRVTGKVEGATGLWVKLGELETTGNLTVVPASLTEIELTAEETTLGRGSVYQFTVQGTYRDGTAADLTETAVWTSSDETVLTKVNTGWKAVKVGAATLTATVEEMSATVDVTVECRYPADAPSVVRDFETMPHVRWTSAYDGETGQEFEFDLEDVACGDEWKDMRSLTFVVSAEWCTPCRARMEALDRMKDQLAEQGNFVIYNEIRNLRDQPIVTSRAAHEFIEGIIPGSPSVRLGDADSTPTRNIFNNSPGFITAFPTLFVVRTSDMKMIAKDTGNISNLLEVVEHPEWDWRDLNNPVMSFESKCGDRADESFEPNDTPAEAPEVGALAVEGGICAEGPDYYRVNIQGRYRITLLFEHEIGNLDVYVWNEQSNAPLMSGNNPVGSYSNNNNESFEHEGPALLRVEGASNASAPYTFYIEEL